MVDAGVLTDSKYVSHSLSKKEKRLLKKAEKKKQKSVPDHSKKSEQEGPDNGDNDDKLDLNVLEESEDEKEVEEFEGSHTADAKKEEKPTSDNEEGILYNNADVGADTDAIPHTKLKINNTAAIKEVYERIRIPWEKYQFDESQAITYTTRVESQITDLYDDTERELQFVKQGLDAATEGKKKLLALKIPFSRPADYFAEMVKSDEHMEKLKSKLIQEASEKKAKEDAKRQRELKKFGKQRDRRRKRETMDKIKSLRKRRQNNDIGEEEFNIELEEASQTPQGLSRKKRRIQRQMSAKGKGKKKTGKKQKKQMEEIIRDFLKIYVW
ncbi:hypothetical protein HII12_001307 [Brettanomyces bruxellensis]|uniref:rRNA-processing protein EBP2 n=1 Tax=Dekkera bruxellensis TaxID=5007 RepID=A0A8H6EYE4_DEKBR|nr:hypothetical protein HII12_001307 [Brettanomyces bruxellensis]